MNKILHFIFEDYYDNKDWGAVIGMVLLMLSFSAPIWVAMLYFIYNWIR